METSYGVNAPEAVKLWSRKLAREALKKTYARRFMGTGSNSLIQVKNETSKQAGDRVRITLRMQLSGDGVAGDATLEGNEEALTTYTDDVVINQLRHGVISEGKMTEQRIPFSIRDEGMQGLSDWWADRYDQWFFNHLCGYTPANTEAAGSGLKFTGHNAVTAPTRQVWSESGTTTDEGLDSTGDTFSLSVIDAAVERAKTGTPPIRPVMVDGQPYYVVFLHPYQVTDLRANGTQWDSIQKAAMQGGKISDNPIFTGALGLYNGCVLHESTRVTTGVNSSTGADIATVRRALLCGAQSAAISFGQGHSQSSYSWFEQLFDYGNKLGVKCGCICGIKKLVWNSQDFATVVMSTYAVAH
jgi:N4-gp56 family major capsid protein